MARLSVDIDLTYVPVAPRAESLAAVDAAMKRIIERIKKAMPDAKVVSTVAEGAIVRLLVRQGKVQTKIEVTPVLRGCVYEPETRAVSDPVEADFGFAEMPVVSFADLYAARSSPPSIASIPVICSMSKIFWRTRGSTTLFERHSSSICSAMIGRCSKSCPRSKKISRTNSFMASKV
jgi:Nucleotidyl transferase AbiEii toxin, Type IV TA system